MLYAGTNYGTRDPSYDEVYSVPPTISITGLTDVSFAPLTGRPNASGAIFLTSLTGEQRTVTVRITQEGIIINDGDKLTICHKPHTSSCSTKKIPDNAWPAHQGHGDTQGPCSPCNAHRITGEDLVNGYPLFLRHKILSMLNIQTLRKGFTLVEILLVLGIVSVVGGISVPLYREFQIRNDLNLAMEQTVQGLRRAQILSQAAQNDDEWGFYVPAGTLYKGRSYETRDVAYDEVYPMPSNIGTTGLLEVSYAKTSGKANDTGTITLHAANDETRSIVVEVISEGVATTLNDNFSICHHPPGNPENSNTLSISDSAWPSHESHGDTLGACPGDPDPDSEESSSSSSSSAASNSSGISSAQSSAGGASSGGGSSAGGGGGAVLAKIDSR